MWGGNPDETQSAPGQAGKRGAEQAQLADAFMRGQDLSQRSGRPTPSGKLGVKIGKSRGNGGCSGPTQAVAAPQVGPLEQDSERGRHSRHGQRTRGNLQASKRSANHADAQAFDGEIVLAQIDDDGLELGILRE